MLVGPRQAFNGDRSSGSWILPHSRHQTGAWSSGTGGTHFNTKLSLLAENSYSTGRGAITQMKVRSSREECGYRIMNQLWWEHRGEKIPSVLGNPRGLQGRDHFGVLLSFWGCGLDKWEGSWSSVTQSCPTLCSPMDYSLQALLPMEFSRKEYWNGVPFPPPRDFPDPGIELFSLPSPALAGVLYH